MLLFLIACNLPSGSPPPPEPLVANPAPEVVPAPEAKPAPEAQAVPEPPPAPVGDAAPVPTPPPAEPSEKSSLKATDPAKADPGTSLVSPAVDPALEAKLAAAKKAVDDIYAPYLGDSDPPEVKKYFSRGLRAQLEAVEKYEESNDTLVFDFDPVINGQDWEIKGLSTTATGVGEKVQVVASFKNSGRSEKLTYTMVLEGESWKVDNIRSSKWDLRRLLKVPKQD